MMDIVPDGEAKWEQLGHQEYYIGYKFFNCYDTK